MFKTLQQQIINLNEKIEKGTIKIAFPDKTIEKTKQKVITTIKKMESKIQKDIYKTEKNSGKYLSNSIKMLPFTFSARNKFSGFSKKKFEGVIEANAKIQYQLENGIKQDFFSNILYLTKNLRKAENISEKIRNDIQSIKHTIEKITEELIDNTSKFYAYMAKEEKGNAVFGLLNGLKEDFALEASKDKINKKDLSEILSSLEKLKNNLNLTLNSIETKGKEYINELKNKNKEELTKLRDAA